MRSKLGWACALAWALSGCFYPAERGRTLETRVDQLSDDDKKLGEEMRAKLTELSQRSDAKITEMNKAMETLETAEHRSGADTGVQLQKVIEDVAQLRGQIESYVFKLTELQNQLDKMNEDVAARLTQIQGAEAVKAAEAKKKAEEMKRPSDKREFFTFAEGKAKGDPALGRELYNEFLKKWPKDDLDGDAHYGIGETYFGEDKCREALAEYGKVIQSYPKAKTAPTSYLRSADCFKKLKMDKESKLALEELVRSYPKTEAATKAKARLKGTK